MIIKNSKKEKLKIKNINKILPDSLKVIKFYEDYKGSTTKCITFCQIHGNSADWGNPWFPRYCDLKVSKGCLKCIKHYIRTENDFISDFNLLDDKLKLIKFFNGFHNLKSLCILECKIHGRTDKWENPWIPTLRNIINGKKCLKCEGKYCLSENEAILDLELFFEKNNSIKFIKFIEKYKGSNTKCKVKCIQHGDGSDFENIWTPTILGLKRGGKCPKCLGKYRDTEKEALENINEKLKFNNYKVIGFYEKFKSNKTKCITECNTHGLGTEWGNPWVPTLSSLKMGFTCPKCVGQYKETKKEAIKNINSLLSNKDIDFVGFTNKYIDQQTRCILNCKIHGNSDKWLIPSTPRYKQIKKNISCKMCSIEGRELKNCLIYPRQYKTSKILYFIKFKNLKDDKCFYKIGITKSDIKDRFPNAFLKKDNVEIIDYNYISSNNINVLIAEYWALRYFNDKRKYMKHILKYSNGGTECFNEDITKIMSLEEIIERSKNDFENILNDFELTNIERKNAIKAFKIL